MQDDLIGYLMGALDPQEMLRIEQRLRHDADLRRELEALRSALQPLAEDRDADVAMPDDLVARTLAAIPPVPDDRSQREVPLDAIVASAASQTHQPPGLSPETRLADRPAWRWQDGLAASLSASIVLALLLPYIHEGRFEARRRICEDHLRRFGTALTQFVTRSEQDRLPAIAAQGPEAFAGMYAVRLRDAGLMDDLSLRWCPSLGVPEVTADESAAVDALVSTRELHAAAVQDLRLIQQYAGGHYAYTLGVTDGDRYQPPRYEHRSTFAVMADAPLFRSQPWGSETWETPHGHGGLNVLYEDGRVRFVSLDSMAGVPDHPLQNHHGEIEAGVTLDDASLAPSWRPPFLNLLQR